MEGEFEGIKRGRRRDKPMLTAGGEGRGK